MSAGRYLPPELPRDAVVARLQPTDVPAQALSLDTLVKFINRGHHTLDCQFDGQHYEIPPGWSEVRFAAALHFRDRLIVPGTRDANNVLAVQSWIAIPGEGDPRLDAPATGVMFTDAELLEFGERTEGLDRETVEDDDRTVEAVSMRDRKGRRAPRPAKAPRVPEQFERQPTAGAKAKAAKAFSKPKISDAEREAAERMAAG